MRGSTSVTGDEVLPPCQLWTWQGRERAWRRCLDYLWAAQVRVRLKTVSILSSPPCIHKSAPSPGSGVGAYVVERGVSF